jgi:hypothetical protein
MQLKTKATEVALEVLQLLKLLVEIYYAFETPCRASATLTLSGVVGVQLRRCDILPKATTTVKVSDTTMFNSTTSAKYKKPVP